MKVQLIITSKLGNSICDTKQFPIEYQAISFSSLQSLSDSPTTWGFTR